tara:strand:+ start:454 stop:1413 length:960 start_codon:yes stop_codon:yes gene_type:complete
MRNKIALIFGISGQDGAYLADFLLKKKYKLLGITRNSSKSNLFRLKKLKIEKKIKIYQNKILNPAFLKKVFTSNKIIDEMYFLSGETSPLRSIAEPIQTFDGNVINLIKILEFIKSKKIKTKFFYASSSEIFKKNKKNIFNENSEIGPRSPYGISKATGLWIVKYYRKQHNLFCCSGILFNHESPLRSNKFVFKKIIQESKKIKRKGGNIYLGNLNIERDIGWAPDYIKAFWKMLQLSKASDLVIGSGNIYSIKTFLNLTFEKLKLNKKKIKANKKSFIRANEINSYRANPSLAKKKIKWKNRLKLKEIVSKMINDELY